MGDTMSASASESETETGCTCRPGDLDPDRYIICIHGDGSTPCEGCGTDHCCLLGCCGDLKVCNYNAMYNYCY